jgi:hypothetical protein
MTRAAALAQFFRARPGSWHSSRDLAAVAGFCGWRGRISDIRKTGMTIECRVRRVQGPSGPCKVSEYRYVPTVPKTAATLLEMFQEASQP